MRINSLARFVVAPLLLCLPSCSAAPRMPDGTYFGYERMCSLDLSEPLQEWFHENVLRIEGSSVTLEKWPGYIRDGALVASASDGGFYFYQGRIGDVSDRVVVALRLVQCHYCSATQFPTLPSPRTDEYLVRRNDDGSFEIDHVVYRTSPDPARHVTGVR